MKVRTTMARTRLGSRFAAVGCGILVILASAALSGCTGSSPPAALPTTSSPGPSTSATPTATSSSTAGSSPRPQRQRVGQFLAPPHRDRVGDGDPDPTPTPTPTPSPTPSPFPTAAPVTGGGGTAGFQHALLLGLGAAAILAGAGSIVYRRRVVRNR